MTGESSVRAFLRTAMIVAALAGVTAGVVLATNESVRAWHTNGMALGDMAYAVVVAAMLLSAVVIFLASANARKMPVLPLALAAVVLGVAFTRISTHLTGTPQGLIGAGAYLFDGLGAGMLLAYWMMRRIYRDKGK